MTRGDVREWLMRSKLVPVVRAGSAEEALGMADRLYAGGIDVFEVTTTVPGAVEVIRDLVSRFGDGVLVGAGTIMDWETAEQCLTAGAKFVVSPHLDLGIVEQCRTYGVLVAPGALTPNEVLQVVRSGADVVKVFPCDAVGGACYLKALKGPFPGVDLMPTGGVNLETLRGYLEAGAVAVGVGSALVDREMFERGPEGLTELARAFRAVVDDFQAV